MGWIIRIRIWAGARNFSLLQNVQICAGVQTSCYSMGTKAPSPGYSGENVALATYLHLRLRLSWVELYQFSSYMPSWRRQEQFYLYFFCILCVNLLQLHDFYGTRHEYHVNWGYPICNVSDITINNTSVTTVRTSEVGATRNILKWISWNFMWQQI
jgi:hypothetical protein